MADKLLFFSENSSKIEHLNAVSRKLRFEQNQSRFDKFRRFAWVIEFTNTLSCTTVEETTGATVRQIWSNEKHHKHCSMQQIFYRQSKHINSW